MSIYGELDPMSEHKTQFAFKVKREHIAKANIPNIPHPNQHIDVKITHDSRDHIVVPDTVKITFNLDTDKTCSIVNNVVRALAKKKVVMLGSKEIETINNSDIYDTYKDLYLSEKEREEKLLQGIQSGNGLKACVVAKKADGTAIIVTTQENAIKKTFGKRFAVPLDLPFFKHPLYPYGIKEDLIVRLELNSSEKVILCTLSKKGTTWKIEVNNLSVCSLQGLLLIFLDNRDDFANKNEEFYNPSIKTNLTTITGMPHQSTFCSRLTGQR